MWRHVNAVGHHDDDAASVLGTVQGSEPVGRFRTAWVTAVLKAHDVVPVWKSYNWTALTPECLAEFRRINLRWHDLRHEYASRLVEKNVPLAQVRDLLGHASITTTERYDNQKLENLQAAAARLERGETFDPRPRESGSPSICQVSVKSSVDEEPGDEIDRVRETSAKYGEDLDLESWLGGRDSNPDNVVQSHVSYRWTTSQYQSGVRDEAGNSDYSQSKRGPASARPRPALGDARPRAYRARRSLLADRRRARSDRRSRPSLAPARSVCSCLRRWLAMPPLRPASRASSLVHSCAVPF